MRDVLIDLGDVPSGGPDGPEPVLPGGPVPYRWILTALTAVLLLVLGGGGPPPPPPPGPLTLPIELGETMQVADDRLFVIGPGEPIGAVVRTHTIRSYELPEVNPLGTYAVTVSGDIFAVVDGGDDILLVGYTDSTSGEMGLVAARAGGGPAIWKRPAMVFGVAPDGGSLLIVEENGPVDAGARQIWRAVDPRTGVARWSVEQPENGQVAIRNSVHWYGYPDRLHTLHGDGRLTAHDARTGAVVATGRTGLPVGPDTSFWAAGGMVLVGRGTDGTVAFDDRTLTERWRRDGPLVPDDGYAQDCRPMICVIVMQEGIIGIDPATGREAWRAPGFDTSEVAGDRILVSQVSQTDPALAVLDAHTGRVVATPGPWSAGGRGPEPGTAYVHRLQLSDNTVRYGLLDLDTGRIRVRGAGDRVAGDCQFAREVLLCRRLGSSIGVWRL